MGKVCPYPGRGSIGHRTGTTRDPTNGLPRIYLLRRWVNKGRRMVGTHLGTRCLRIAAHRRYLLPHDTETGTSSEATLREIRFHSVPSAFITQRSVPTAPGAAGQ